jgi:hypothetical protein
MIFRPYLSDTLTPLAEQKAETSRSAAVTPLAMRSGGGTESTTACADVVVQRGGLTQLRQGSRGNLVHLPLS